MDREHSGSQDFFHLAQERRSHSAHTSNEYMPCASVEQNHSAEIDNTLSDLPNGDHIEMWSTAASNQSEMKSIPNTNKPAFTIDRPSRDNSSYPTRDNTNVRYLPMGYNNMAATEHSSQSNLKAIEHYALSMNRKLKKERNQQLLDAEWTIVARVLDRFFFALYLVLIITSLCIFFPKPG